VEAPNSWASEPSLQLGASSRVITRRASFAVSSTSNFGHGRPCSAAKCLRKPTSNGALCATSTQPCANSRNWGAPADRGAATIESVMPVSTAMNAGIAWCGLTRVWNSPRTSPPRTLTAPISVIIEPPWADPPVVSRSTTQNVTSRRDRPSSSKLRCDSHFTPAPGPADGVMVLLMDATLDVGTDQNGQTRAIGLRPRTRPTCHTEPSEERPVAASLPDANTRWRCGGCGNLTRFDVTRTRRTTEFWHFDLAGEHQVEESKTQSEDVESVTCRWCGRSDAIELVDRTEADTTSS
jgi:hypothetical protein